MRSLQPCWLIAGLIAFQASHAQAPASPPAASAEAASNRLEAVTLAPSEAFGILDVNSGPVQQMRERLADPVQREVLRAEERKQIQASHVDLAQALDIDAATEQALIDLLTDQRLQQLDEFHAPVAATPEQFAIWREHAARQTQRMDALRALLGQAKLERYQQYEKTTIERRQVAMLDAQLEPALKLSVEQKERLIDLWHTYNGRTLEGHRGFDHATLRHDPLTTLPSREELQRRAQLQTIASNEALWHRKSKADAELRAEAASFLSPPQLAALERVHAEAADELERWIQQMRLSAGLSPQIPDEPEVTESETDRLEGDVKITVHVAVNAEPTLFTQVVRNGQTVSFMAAEGLLVEATATLYSDEMFDLRMAYYERTEDGKRLIGEMGQMGNWSRNSPPPTLDLRAGAATVVTGSKGYAIEVASHVQPMQAATPAHSPVSASGRAITAAGRRFGCDGR